MNSKKTKTLLSQEECLENMNRVDFCKVSKASAEIMLERFCNGKKIDFPFSQ